MITKTDAVVLKSMKFRDTSKIVTFYTRRFGKIKGIAKGARESKSKFGGTLEPLSLVSLVLYKKEHRDLHLISQCDILSPFKKLHSEIERMYIGLAVAELVNQLAHEEEGNDQLFRLLCDTFEVLEKAPKNFLNLLFAFELRFASLFGFAPSFESCLRCKRPRERGAVQRSFLFDPGRGGVLCDQCDPGKVSTHLSEDFSDAVQLNETSIRSGRGGLIRILPATVGVLERLLSAPLESLSGVELDASVRNEIEETLRLYLRYHFDGFRGLKSTHVLEAITHS